MIAVIDIRCIGSVEVRPGREPEIPGHLESHKCTEEEDEAQGAPIRRRADIDPVDGHLDSSSEDCLLFDQLSRFYLLFGLTSDSEKS